MNLPQYQRTIHSKHHVQLEIERDRFLSEMIDQKSEVFIKPVETVAKTRINGCISKYYV